MNPDGLDRAPGPDHRSDTPNHWITSPQARKYIYLGVALVVAGLVVFDVLSEDQVEQWVETTIRLIQVGAVLLAAVNTPREA